MDVVMQQGAEDETAQKNLIYHMLSTSGMSPTSIVHNTVSLLVAGIDSVSIYLCARGQCVFSCVRVCVACVGHIYGVCV